MVLAAGAGMPLGCRMAVVMEDWMDVVVEVLVAGGLTAILVVVFDHGRGPEVVAILVVDLAEPVRGPVGPAVSSRRSFYHS